MTLDRDVDLATWRDTTAPTADRVADLVARMTLPEKLAQLGGIWVGIDAGGEVAPKQHEFTAPIDWEKMIAHGIGQLTRVYGSSPITPEIGLRGITRSQRQVTAASRFGIPAMVHEESLTGLTAWQATVYPSPLCWGASFDPELVERMGARIGGLMRRLGVHQGLAPVLDVVRDLRWGRTEETIGEDPFLVGVIGASYVRGLESAGIVATLKHFAGHSASRAGRNQAPVSIGPRELADVMLPPFEMALRAGARSVMNSYTDVDGMPAAADASLLTDLLRSTYGFTGTVVADYFAVAFLRLVHNVAASDTDAAKMALQAGIDIELPTVTCFGEPLRSAVETGDVAESLIDRALRRVLTQKCELGLLDPDWCPEPAGLEAGVDMDDAESRSLALELARRSIVLLRNENTLPLAFGSKIALVGPLANTTDAMLGCYSFPRHVGVHHPDVALGVDIPTVLAALRADPAGYDLSYALGCPVLGGSDADIRAAVEVARQADVCVAVLGDRAGMFGDGTSGEGCDVGDLRLPGRQGELLSALLATGKPVVLVLFVGRPYVLGPYVDGLAAALCGFFPGEEGARALADILSGRVNPSGRLPVGFPGDPAGQPAPYLAAPLAGRHGASTVDPSSLYPFGHGLTYAPVTWGEVSASSPVWTTDGVCRVSVPLRNDAAIASSEVVQVYLHDPVAEVARPVRQLVAAARVDLAPGTGGVVELELHADLTSYTGRAGRRQVDTGDLELLVGASSTDIRAKLSLSMTGDVRAVGFDRVMVPSVRFVAG